MNDKIIFAGKEQLKPQLRRALINLEDEDWQKADSCCERVLDEEPEDPYAYIIKLMAVLNVRDEGSLWEYNEKIGSHYLFKKALGFANDRLKENLMSLADGIADRVDQKQRALEEIERVNSYHKALGMMGPDATEKELESARMLLCTVRGYRDADSRIAICEERIHLLREEAQQREEAENRARTRKILVITAAVLAATAFMLCMRVRSCNTRAQKIAENLIGRCFSGEYLDVDRSSGSIVEGRVTYVDTTFKFFDDTIEVTEVRSTDYDGTIIVINGKKQFDDIEKETETVEKNEVVVPFFGDPSIVIDGKRYQIVVNANDIPTSLAYGNIKFPGT